MGSKDNEKKINYGLHEWQVNHEDLLTDFITEAKPKFHEINEDIAKLRAKKYSLLEHPGNSIDRVLARIKLVECLKKEMNYTEIYNRTIGAGINADCGTYIYLTFSCFDVLGRDPSFKTLDNWIRSNKTLDDIVNSSKAVPLKNVLDAKITEYSQLFGMKQSFRRFFCKYLQDEEKMLLFKRYWVTKNKNIKNHGIHSHYAFGPDDSWKLLANDPNDCLRKIADKVADIRNKFSHAGMSVQIHSDKKTAHGEKWPPTNGVIGGDLYVNPLRDKEVLCFITESVLEDMISLVKSGLIGFVKDWAK